LRSRHDVGKRVVRHGRFLATRWWVKAFSLSLPLTLPDLVSSTIGSERLARMTDKPGWGLHRMLSDEGNPGMDNLAAISRAMRACPNFSVEAHSVAA
jgi:hypothetical protein